MNTFLCVLVICLVGGSVAHPAYQHHFHRIVKSDQCLSSCMKIVQESETELSILKRANISGFLLDLNHICDTIENARSCIAECDQGSNPFALQSMTTICEEEVRKDVALLGKCLAEEGDVIYNGCRDSCGDYEAINDEVHRMTMAMSPNPHDAEKAAKIMEKTNEACGVLKCSSRCSIDQYTSECGDLENGKDAGELIRSLIERVLEAQRSDLEKLGLTDTMAQSVPVQCNYMYLPEVMFNSTKDELSQFVIEDMAKAATAESLNKQPATTEVPDQIHLVRHKAHSEISYTLGQQQTRLIQKQFLVLEEQERNLKKEAKKLDLEILILGNKKAIQDIAYAV